MLPVFVPIRTEMCPGVPSKDLAKLKTTVSETSAMVPRWYGTVQPFQVQQVCHLIMFASSLLALLSLRN